MTQRPVALGVHLCEQVIVEEATKNGTLVNCFTRRAVRQFRSEAFPFVVFATLTNGLGEMTLEAQIQRLDTLDAIFRRPLRVRFTSVAGGAAALLVCHRPSPGSR